MSKLINAPARADVITTQARIARLNVLAKTDDNTALFDAFAAGWAVACSSSGLTIDAAEIERMFREWLKSLQTIDIQEIIEQYNALIDKSKLEDPSKN
jgi:hypothetical protein